MVEGMDKITEIFYESYERLRGVDKITEIFYESYEWLRGMDKITEIFTRKKLLLGFGIC